MRRAESCQKLRTEHVLPRPVYFVTQIRPRDIFHFHRAGNKEMCKSLNYIPLAGLSNDDGDGERMARRNSVV